VTLAASHPIFLHTICNHGLCDSQLHSVPNYLNNQRYSARNLDKALSLFFNVLSEIPRESILGYLLFYIFINDLHNVTKYVQLLFPTEIRHFVRGLEL